MEMERRRLRHGSISATGILQPPSTAVGSVISCMSGRWVRGDGKMEGWEGGVGGGESGTKLTDLKQQSGLRSNEYVIVH